MFWRGTIIGNTTVEGVTLVLFFLMPKVPTPD